MDGTAQTTMEARMDAHDREIRDLTQMLRQVLINSGASPPAAPATPPPAPAPQTAPPPAPAPAPASARTPKGKPIGATAKDPAPYGHDPATPEQIKPGVKMLVNPDCNSPFKGKYIKVAKVATDGKVKFIKRENKKDVEKTTQSQYLVIPRPSPSQVMARKAMEHYGLKENDIFLTPDMAFQVIADHVGLTLEDAKAMFDPCPPPDEMGNFAPDGRTVPWADLTFCNPPFSQWPEWVQKAVDEAKLGKRIILLIGASSYFLVGKDKKQQWFDFHREVDIDLIKWCDQPMGIIHTLKWGPNEITGENTGGPREGIVIMDIKQRGKHYDNPVGSPSAGSIASMGEIEYSAEEMAEVQRRRRVAFLSEADAQDPPSPAETLDLPSPDSHTTWGTSMEEATSFTLLEMFCGTGSAGKVVELIPGAKVFSVDINPETMGYHPSKVADIMKLDFTKLKFNPDVIWCSPPCQTYSIMGGGKHRTKADMEPKTEAGVRGREMLQKTVDMINYFKRVNLTRPNIIPYLRWL